MQKPVAMSDAYVESVIAELEALRTEEHRLIRLYERLRKYPVRTMRFLMDLADLRDRTDRLDAMLEPIPQLNNRDARQVVYTQMEQPCA
jgi:hypothetical protein